MLVVGIDPGTARTGYGFVRQEPDGSLVGVGYGVITTAASKPLSERLLEIAAELALLLRRYQPVSGAVEKLFFQRNVSTAMSVGQARGVAMLALAEAGLSVEEYTPAEVKQAVCGFGEADKRQMQHMVQILLNMPELPRPDDAADALAVAICHLHSHKARKLEARGP